MISTLFILKAKKLTHLYIKPQNLLINISFGNHITKLSDFGESR